MICYDDASHTAEYPTPRGYVAEESISDMSHRTPRRPQSSLRRYLIPDPVWDRIEPLLPKRVNHHRFGGGRPPVPDRKAMNGIFFVLKTGCQWNALNDTGICSSSTAHSRFQEWTAAGIFEKLWASGLEEYDELKGIKWRWQSMDGAMTKAPLGGEKNRAEPDRPGQAGRQAQSPVRGTRRSGRSGRGLREPA